MYSAILISLYTLFKYAWVIKQFLLESGKKSIKKKNLRQSEHTECCPDELSIVSFILPGHHHLSNCYRMILLIHKAYILILNNLYSSCKMIQLNDPYIMKSKYWKCNCDCNWELSWQLYILGHHPSGCYRVLLLINSQLVKTVNKVLIKLSKYRQMILKLKFNQSTKRAKKLSNIRIYIYIPSPVCMKLVILAKKWKTANIWLLKNIDFW